MGKIKIRIQPILGQLHTGKSFKMYYSLTIIWLNNLVLIFKEFKTLLTTS